MTFRRGFAVILGGLVLSGCMEPRVQLNLGLAKTKWMEWDLLRYKLELVNLGSRTVTIDDPFWWFQSKLLENQRSQAGTYLVLTDDKGEVVRPTPRRLFDPHAVLPDWVNDCGSGVDCDDKGYLPVALRLGDSIVATPSIYRYRKNDAPNNDLEHGGEAGYRVLDDYPLRPGRYRAKAVASLRKDSSLLIKGYEIHVESVPIAFEVRPRPLVPKHLRRAKLPAPPPISESRLVGGN